MTTSPVFISYRRDDSLTEARLLYTELINYFGPNTVFLDKKRLDPGMDWPDELETNVRNARVLLILIQYPSKWLGVNDFGVRRLDDFKDWVRKEIETALREDKIVIPVLLNGAQIPPVEVLPGSIHHLTVKQAVQIKTEDWDSGTVKLFKTLEKHITRQPSEAPKLEPLAEYPIPNDKEFDPLPHHPAPFLGLRYFDKHAARLFFGRTRELLDFFGYIENPDIRLIYLCGHSGVGKSSFLAAGVLPRLQAFRQLHYERRNKAEGLGKQLQKLLSVPKEPGKPPVYILDQVEEIFTDWLPDEQENFVTALNNALRHEPDATFVLGFRSDYIVDFSELLACLECNRETLALRLLDETALVDAIEGVCRDEKLKKRYCLELEQEFAQFVARHLMNSESGSVASILQNRLLKLYTEAKKQRTATDPLVRLCIKDYEILNQNPVSEVELLDFQLQHLRDEGLHYNADERTILEMLNRFVVDKPTAGTVLKESLGEENSRLRDGLRHVNLLSEIPDGRAIRLSHDLLAPIVRKRYTQALLDETERLEIENVQLKLRRVRELLSNIEFMEAWEELKGASLLNVVPDEVWPLAFELSFVLLQANRQQEGILALYTCVNYLHFVQASTVPAFPVEVSPGKYAFQDLMGFLRQCNSRHFMSVERRYFPVMRRVEGGGFDMGDVQGDSEYKDETVHWVELNTFELAQTPLTWYQYGLYCLATGQGLPNDSDWGKADRPVINVSWHDAVAYLHWLNTRNGLEPAIAGTDDENNSLNLKANGYRLPTEAEWEYAARERGKPVRFGNGKEIADPAEINFDGSATSKKDYSVIGENRSKTTPVYQFKPNALGLHDMSGNVYDWCWDWYGQEYYQNSPAKNPLGPDSGSSRVLRGGAWFNFEHGCRVAYRYYVGPGLRDLLVGFRPARTVGF